ncbi:MAG: glutamate mutase L, partial [Phototrophicaceae bacterium]
MVDQYGSSLLAVDFGSVRTRAVLVDAVDGVYRLVARADSRTTDGFPVNDLMVAFERVTRQLSQTTNRRFTADSGLLIMPEQSDRSGVDHFVLTASIGRPLRAVLVGLVPEVSVASALRAAAGTYIEVAGVLSLDDGMDDEARLNLIQTRSPDVILIAGGTEAGAQQAVLRQAETVQMAVALMPEPRRPLIVYS